MKRKKNKSSFLKVVIIVLLLIVVAVIAYKFFISNNINNVRIIDRIQKYNYSLKSNATEYQKKLFSELKKILRQDPINEEDYAKNVSQIFIADLFTLSNKMTNSDIGGIDYVFSDFKNDYISIVQNSIYKDIKNNLYKKRNQSLPQVTNVEIIDIKKDKFLFKKIEYDCYNISTNITYKTSLGYPETYNLVIIKNKERLDVAKGFEK